MTGRSIGRIRRYKSDLAGLPALGQNRAVFEPTGLREPGGLPVVVSQDRSNTSGRNCSVASACWSGRRLPVIMDLHERRSAILERLESHVNRQRLVETAGRLIEVPSPTGRGRGGQRPAGGDPRGRRVRGRAARGRPSRLRRPSRSGSTAAGRGGRSSSTATSTRSTCRSSPPRGRGRPAHRQRRVGHEGGDRRRGRGGPGAPRCRGARGRLGPA